MFIYHDLQYVVVPPSHNISRFSGELKKVYLIKKLHLKMRMTCIMRKLKMTKATYILGTERLFD
jgi:hypothetical protein